MHWEKSNIKLNNFPVETMRFPVGELQVRLATPTPREAVLLATLKKSDDILAMMLTVDAARRAGTRIVHIVAPYIPYARQDRVAVEGEALSIAVIANLINSMRCESVVMYDPHSDVTPALINNAIIMTQADLMKNMPAQSIHEVIVAPDAGAAKANKALGVALKFGRGLVTCGKKRDVKTGEITGQFIADGEVYGRSVTIVDDICDGGATSAGLAPVLKAAGATRINMFVTHGIFSKGFQPFAEHFEEIFFTNSLAQDPRCGPECINIWRQTK